VVDAQGSESWCRAALALLLQATGSSAPPALGLLFQARRRRLLQPERVGVEGQPSARIVMDMGVSLQHRKVDGP
jgi:hypothetical protein